MRLRLVARVLSLISLIVSLCMIFPMIWSVVYGESDFHAFAASLACGVTISFALFRLSFFRLSHFFPNAKPSFPQQEDNYGELGIREAFAVVGLSWVTAASVGALPYMFEGTLQSFTDAFFETVSGFSTTGATVIADVEIVPHGILFWRGLTHWLGGMGIIVLSLAVLPFLGVGGMELYKAEVPGPTPEKLSPRVQQTALLLWGIYVLLTVLETAMLMLGGMSFFDALVHSFGTIATGGFSTKNASIAYYNSAYIEWVITFFMFISGVNFSLHFLFLTGAWRKALMDEELLLYGKIFLGASALIAAGLLGAEIFQGAGKAARTAAFYVASFMTTTGFALESYNGWPYFAQFLVLLLAFIGGCAGSTGGGLKVVRVLVLARSIGLEILSTLHPRAVAHARVNGKEIPPRALNGVMAFFTLYVIVFVGATMAVAAFGGNKLDAVAAISGVVATLSNSGPGLGSLGAPETYAWVPAAVKWVFSFCMLAGRLELYAILLLFLPSTWKR